MALVTDVADAVVAELNATAFSQPLEAKRSYLPQFDLAEMKDLHVTVVPKGGDDPAREAARRTSTRWPSTWPCRRSSTRRTTRRSMP